jgi:hypothetical protein
VGYADSGSGTGRGIVTNGSIISSLIESSYATGDVTQIASGNDGGGVGGLVGSLHSGAILNSYSTGDVRGDTTVGGLVGRVYEYGVNPGLTYNDEPYANYKGLIENSFSTSTINLGYNDANRLGGLVGTFSGGKIVNSYATAGGLSISGYDFIGGLVGDGGSGIIQDSFAYIEGGLSAAAGGVGGLAGSFSGSITDSFAFIGGVVSGGNQVGGLVGVFSGDQALITGSYSSVGDLQAANDNILVGTLIGDYNETPIDFIEVIQIPSLPSMVSIVNTDDETESFGVSSCFNSGLPYLTSLTNTYSNTCSNEEETSPMFNFSFLPTQVLDGLSKSVGFLVAKSDLSNLDISFLDQVKGDKSAQINGAKIFTNQFLVTSILAGSRLQLEISFEANKSLQLWVKSSDGLHALVGDITFDKNGNAVLPGIEFKKSGQYEFIFVNPGNKELTQLELANKVIGLTVYVN